MLNRNCTGMIPPNFGWPILCHTAPPEADLQLLCPHTTGIIPSHGWGVQMVVGLRPPWSCHAQCRMVLAVAGFGQERGMLPWWH